MSLPLLDFANESRVEPLRRAMSRARHGFVRTWAHRLLRRVMSDFDVNAWLGMYPMTFLSTEEWRQLLPEARGRLLDVGAGSGDLTRALRPLVDAVECVEVSAGMVRKLRRDGFVVHERDVEQAPLEGDARFDVVTLLHVLDRTSRPRALLCGALRSASPGALVVVAVPLPYAPIVFRGAQVETPEEPLCPVGLDLDNTKERLRAFLEAEGVSLLRAARVPYLCPGDLDEPYYELDSYVFVGRTPG